ncbi:thioredoxin-like protein [Mrakia frigida]|uniref:DsbA family oxidoreductase n=1 Tax=Mrakia frigida TaxID=29902 RepID=UPI003FCC15BD
MSPSLITRTIKLDITTDAICPFCYIGSKNIKTAIDLCKANDPTLDFALQYHPFLLEENLSTEPVNKRKRFQNQYGVEQFASMEAAMVERGKPAGIAFSYGGEISQTKNAQRLLTFAYQEGGEKMQVPLMKLLFQGYFEEERDVGDFDFLGESGVAVGLFESVEAAKTFLSSELMVPEVEKACAHAKQIGIQRVPFVVLNLEFGISGAQEVEKYAEIFGKVSRGESPM